MKQHIYGWKHSLPDHRDEIFRFVPKVDLALPAKVDLRPNNPPIYDQGQEGSCTANGWARAFEFNLLKENLKDFMPSRQFIYYNERLVEGTLKQGDCGAQVRTGGKVLNQYGVCPETEWTYIPSHLKTKPHKKEYTDALNNTVIQYSAVTQDLIHIKSVLAGGELVVFGISVYDSFESQEVASTGKVPMPLPNESCLGGHCITLVGYDDSINCGIVANSWGTSWGLAGYFLLPYAYITSSNLASDFWCINNVK